jgi:hypothetical protein
MTITSASIIAAIKAAAEASGGVETIRRIGDPTINNGVIVQSGKNQNRGYEWSEHPWLTVMIAGLAAAITSSGALNTILNGLGAPGTSLGSIDDFYVDVAGWRIYGPKEAAPTGWGTGASIVGPAGPMGPVGSANMDGGIPSSTYGAISPIDGGVP